MLGNYADSKEGLQIFGSAQGKKMTALDAYDDKQFVTDPSALPKIFFSSPQQFNNLVEMVGDKALAMNAAKDYVANQVSSLTSGKQVGDWMVRNRNFLKAVPEIRTNLENYRMALDTAERTGKNIEFGLTRLKKGAEGVLANAESSAAATRAGGELQSRIAKEEGEKLANTLFSGTMGNVKQARTLIEGGDVKAWQAAAPVIERSPQAKKAFVDAVQQVMAERPMKGASQYFNETVRPAVEAAGLLPKAEADRIFTELARIESLRIPDPEKLGLKRRVMLNAFGGEMASLQGRQLPQQLGGLYEMIPR
jgi:hypothetical protein